VNFYFLYTTTISIGRRLVTYRIVAIGVIRYTGIALLRAILTGILSLAAITKANVLVVLPRRLLIGPRN
jgi:hypothetical protein